jgi:hypothetical protein
VPGGDAGFGPGIMLMLRMPTNEFHGSVNPHRLQGEPKRKTVGEASAEASPTDVP